MEADLTLFPGAFASKKKDGSIYYRSSLTYQTKHISLGSFSTPQEASLAYREGNALLGRRVCEADRDKPHNPSQAPSGSEDLYDPALWSSYTPADYEGENYTLPFEKWVILCNVRDNGLYLGAPIYIRPSFFYYYFGPHDFFLFSMEDLFYYAAHRIQKRGGHYFVAEYGMQVNIMNRYGIKNYAVPDKDYRFRNGNSSDYRYENIEIINTYQGVTVLQTPDGLRYQVKIHVKGYRGVGVYDSPVLAAIAYNKAADELGKLGVNKRYQLNELDQLSASAYADLYSKLEIRDLS